MLIDPIIILISKIIIAGLFFHAGLHKARDILEFQKVLMNYGVMGGLIKPTSFFIATGEIILAACIFINGNLAMMVAGGILGFYTLLLAYNYLSGRRIDCGCSFGRQDEQIGRWHIVRNVVLLSVVGINALPVIERALVWLDYSTAIFASLVIGMIFLIIEQLNINHHYFNRIRNAS